MLADAHCAVVIAPDCTAAQSVHLVAHTAGFLSYLILWFTVMWGMMLGRGWAMTRFKHSQLYATHMTLALIAMTLGWGHAFIQLANPIGTVHLIDEFIPFANGRDPIGIGVGVIATEIMTALLISMPLQRKLGYGRWRALHSLAYASFTLIAGHILLSGSHVGPLFVKIPVLLMWLSTVVLWVGVSEWSLKRKRVMTDKASSRIRTQQAEVSVKWLRFAHGGVFSAIASVRASTRNDLMRLLAERANGMVNKHMSLLESTGLVQYDNLPHSAIGAPAVALAAATTPTPKDSNFFRLPIIALVVVTGLLAVVSIRRVVGGS